jgi:CBS domain containing-hemolysin-like protein
MLEALDILQEILLFFWQVIKWTWWIFIPIILFINIRDLWLGYVKSKFFKK